ncbi:MAG: XdhC family protein, partial [Burkholderiales bacterium]
MTTLVKDVLETAAAWRTETKGVALATVVATWGSAPRPAGSKLVVAEDGSFEGSVSGGCVEAAVVREALQVIQDKKPRLIEFGVTDDEAWSIG